MSLDTATILGHLIPIAHKASGIVNNSNVSGASVADALNTLLAASSTPTWETVLAAGNTSGANNAQMTTNTQMQLRSSANYLASNAANQLSAFANSVEQFRMGSTGITFNPGGSASIDFGVNSDTINNFLFLDSSTERFGVGPTFTMPVMFSVNGNGCVALPNQALYPRMGGTIMTSNDVDNVGTTETTLISVNLDPDGLLSPGDRIHLIAGGLTNTITATVTFRFKINGVTLTTYSWTLVAAAIEWGFNINAQLMTNGNTYVYGMGNSTQGAQGQTRTDNVEAIVDWSANGLVELTVQLSSGSNADVNMGAGAIEFFINHGAT